MSTQVSNPYSFNIKNNTSFTSQTIAPILPDSDTLLATLTRQGTRTIFVPSGCKVVLLRINSGPDSENMGTTVKVYNLGNNKNWYYNVGDPNGFFGSAYVGVTPGKSYTIKLIGRGDNPSGTIYYSAAINNQTPTVADY